MMSNVNVSFNVIGPGMCNKIGESTRFQDTLTDDHDTAKTIVDGVINDIFDNAVDIALNNASVNQSKQNLAESSPQLKEIIDGLGSINVNKLRQSIQVAEEPQKLDVEMKRLLNEMMSPPYEIVNYDSLARKDGVGDQPLRDISESVVAEQQSSVGKIVEKKSRVTDLVMNSKQVLNELLDDEAKRKQEEWETSTEKELRVIELQDRYDMVASDACILEETSSQLAQGGEGEGLLDGRCSEEQSSKEKKKKKWTNIFRFLGIKMWSAKNTVKGLPEKGMGA